jgi:hypothetical protein
MDLTSLKMSRVKCFLFDADVIIAAHEARAWDSLVASCELHVSSIVVKEVKHFNDHGVRREIDLRPQVASGAIVELSATAEEMGDFLALFDPMLKDMLHQGEIEGLTLMKLDRTPEDCRYCTGDGTACVTLGLIGAGDRAISLQEVCAAAGVTKPLASNFEKDYMRSRVQRGQRQRIQGLGFDKS